MSSSSGRRSHQLSSRTTDQPECGTPTGLPRGDVLQWELSHTSAERRVSAPSPDRIPAAAADAPPRRPSPPPPRDFAELAKRISGRTTDLFAITLVVIVLLSMGTRLTQWWRAEPPVVTAVPANAPLAIWDNPANLAVDFEGGPWKLTRATAAGSAEEVTRAAMETARRTLESSLSRDLPPPDAAELQWLNQLHGWPPQVQTNHGEVFVLGGPWPWIVATQSALVETAESPDASPAADSRRVICWAFALPQSPQQWTLYTAVRATGAATSPSTAKIAIPANAQQFLTARSQWGGITSFRSDNPPRAVQRDWNRQLTADGWRVLSDWEGDEELRRASFTRQTGNNIERLETALIHNADQTTGIADWRKE